MDISLYITDPILLVFICMFILASPYPLFFLCLHYFCKVFDFIFPCDDVGMPRDHSIPAGPDQDEEFLVEGR